MQIRCEILCQDANTVFGRQPGPSDQLANTTSAVYGAMTRVLTAAELLATSPGNPEERRAGLVAARKEVQLVTERVSLLIQRQARFTYLVGVLAGAAATLAVIAAGAVLADRYWSGVLDLPAFARPRSSGHSERW
jgi:hypothetical protein